MNAKERLEAALRFEEPDRVPVNINMGSITQYAQTGIAFEEAIFNSALVVKCLEKLQKIFPENDVLFPLTGQTIAGAEAMGDKAELCSTGWFDITERGIKNMEEFEKLDFNEALEQFINHKMFKTGVEATQTLSKRYRKEFVIATQCWAGFTMAGKVIGPEKEMLLLYDEPDFVKAVADFANRLWIEGLKIFMEAGADMPTPIDPLAMPELIGRKLYNEFAFPLEKSMVKEIKESECYSHLHICGNIETILEDLVETGTSIISFDQKTNLFEAKKKVGDKMTLWGNVDPARMLLGTPEEIMNLSKECIKTAAPGGGYILAPGCDTAKMAPNESFFAMCDAAVKFGRYPIELHL
jgi:uroporphyrinogen decarboxylase